MAISGRELELHDLVGAERKSLQERDRRPSARDERNRHGSKYEVLDGDMSRAQQRKRHSDRDRRDRSTLEKFTWPEE
jgi:hypothetical protein